MEYGCVLLPKVGVEVVEAGSCMAKVNPEVQFLVSVLGTEVMGLRQVLGFTVEGLVLGFKSKECLTSLFHPQEEGLLSMQNPLESGEE